MQFKPTVRSKETKPTIWFALGVVHALYMVIAGRPLTVTSMNDDGGSPRPVHRPKSKHYDDDAFDARTRDLSSFQRDKIVAEARRILEPLGFDVVSSETAGHEHHDHYEYDAKAGEVFVRVVE